MNLLESEDNLLKKLLSRLSRNAFEHFITKLYQVRNYEDYERDLTPISEAGDGVYFRELLDSYGGSLHHIYLLHYLPIELFNHFQFESIADPALIDRLKNIYKLYKGKKGKWGMVDPFLKTDEKLQALAFITNFSGLNIDDYQTKVFPQYERLAKQCGIKKTKLYIGSYDSFIDLSLQHTKEIFQQFITENIEGIRIALDNRGISVDSYVTERNLDIGVFSNSKHPCEPVYVNISKEKEAVLEEFESLLHRNVTETQLEKFLVAHYKDIFGHEYDRIETQIWLRFPNLDIAGRQRRVDIFLHNSIVNDWEIFEIKRVIPLTKTYRDIPVISSEVSSAIHQIKNYSRILAQDSVKKRFASFGIEYYEPSLNLVVGKTPQIPHHQWRWLLETNKDVKILTYDRLLKAMKNRLETRHSIIDFLNEQCG